MKVLKNCLASYSQMNNAQLVWETLKTARAKNKTPGKAYKGKTGKLSFTNKNGIKVSLEVTIRNTLVNYHGDSQIIHCFSLIVMLSNGILSSTFDYVSDKSWDSVPTYVSSKGDVYDRAWSKRVFNGYELADIKDSDFKNFPSAWISQPRLNLFSLEPHAMFFMRSLIRRAFDIAEEVYKGKTDKYEEFLEEELSVYSRLKTDDFKMEITFESQCSHPQFSVTFYYNNVPFNFGSKNFFHEFMFVGWNEKQKELVPVELIRLVETYATKDVNGLMWHYHLEPKNNYFLIDKNNDNEDGSMELMYNGEPKKEYLD